MATDLMQLYGSGNAGSSSTLAPQIGELTEAVENTRKAYRHYAANRNDGHARWGLGTSLLALRAAVGRTFIITMLEKHRPRFRDTWVMFFTTQMRISDTLKQEPPPANIDKAYWILDLAAKNLAKRFAHIFLILNHLQLGGDISEEMIEHILFLDQQVAPSEGGKPEPPDRDEPKDLWFDWYYRTKHAGFKITLGDLAQEWGYSESYVKHLKSQYDSQYGKNPIPK